MKKIYFSLLCLVVLHLNLVAQNDSTLLLPGDIIFGGQVIGDTIFQEGMSGGIDSVNNWPNSEPRSNAIDGFGAKYVK